MPIPIFRISLQNATVLSVAYLMMSVVVEASARWYPLRWTERAAQTVEWIPARTLDWVGLFEPLRRAVLEDGLSMFVVRLVLGMTSIAGIFAVALSVGSLMWLGRWAIERAEKRKAA